MIAQQHYTPIQANCHRAIARVLASQGYTVAPARLSCGAVAQRVITRKAKRTPRPAVDPATRWPNNVPDEQFAELTAKLHVEAFVKGLLGILERAEPATAESEAA